MDGLHQIADKLIHVKTNTFDLGLDNSSAVIKKPGNTRLLVLGVASPLDVGFALVLEHHLLYHMAVRVLVDTIAPHISLTYVRMIPLGRCRCWVDRRLWWSSHHSHSRQTGQVDQVLHAVVL